MNEMRFYNTFFLLLAFYVGNAQQLDYNIIDNTVLGGYDVVSYFEGAPQKGTQKFAIAYNGVQFLFVSEAHLEAFKASQKKYEPQYGGYCAYAVAKRKKMQSNPETYEIRDDKLYLFYNAWSTNTLVKWQQGNTTKLQVKANHNWEKLQFKD